MGNKKIQATGRNAAALTGKVYCNLPHQPLTRKENNENSI